MITAKVYDAYTNEKRDFKEEKELENSIDEKIVKKARGWYPWAEAILDKDYPLNTRNEVAKKYIKEGGWYAVVHQTSFENGERPGLTAFYLMKDEEVWEKWSNCHQDKSRYHTFF